jgi:hypothetical protein
MLQSLTSYAYVPWESHASRQRGVNNLRININASNVKAIIKLKAHLHEVLNPALL